jgi:nucleoside phosphorylase
MTDVSSYVRGRRGLSRQIIDYDPAPEDAADDQLAAAVSRGVAGALAGRWPAGLAPTPINEPAPDPDAPLPTADYVVITWTAAELRALANVLTPGVNPTTKWHPYRRNFDTLLPTIRKGAPARNAKRLASWYRTSIGGKSVLCMKSELHLNQDSMATGPGTATLPVAELFRQIIAEVKPKLIITTGTAGGTFTDADLGDVMITRSARFRLGDEFRNETFNNTTFSSTGEIPRSQLAAATALLDVTNSRLREPDFGPPTTRYPFGDLLPGFANKPQFLCDGVDFKKFHPILTTDFFEFGTSTNKLGDDGCGVEMGDAVLGLVSKELGAAAPRWLVVRNASDPPINGALPTSPTVPDMQAHWAVFYYEQYGYWTSVNSALACWAILAGD